MLNTHNDIDPSNFFRTHNVAQAFELDRGKQLVALGAYCLMPNHFHLYVTPIVGGGVSKFMQRVQTAYTKYFNEKHDRTGSLFEGTFKSEHVKTDRQAKYLFSYVHLNPAKLRNSRWKEKLSRDWKSLRNYVTEYPYSSYREYATGVHRITNPERFPSFLKSKKDVRDHIGEWLRQEGE